MFTPNNQIIIEDLYDETIQPSEEDIIEYAVYIGIDPEQEPELMWIARQGVKAPLPKGWKAVHDAQQNELYYFNFETGESIWDHPCDKDFKNLVKDERKILIEKGRDNYKPSNLDLIRQGSPTKYRSPVSTLKNSDKIQGGTSKSTSTISDLLNGKSNQSKNNLRNDFALFDTRDLGNVEFEEENELKEKDEEEEEEESEASWQKKSGSDDSDDFRKPVDFGIDKETSIKLDKLNVMLMVGKESSIQNNNQVSNTAESAPTTSREVLDSPTRNYVRAVLGYNNNKEDDSEVRKSLSLLESKKQLDSLIEENSSEIKALEPKPKDTQKELKLLQDSLDREFDQRRLELLENKEMRIKKLKEEIERDINRINESESKKLLQEQEEKIKEFKRKTEMDFNKEKENLKRKQNEALSQMQKEFDSEKQLRKQKFSMQLSKFMKSGQSFDELDEDEEKREITIYFEHIEKKYADKLDDRKRELQTRYERKLKDLEEELKVQYDQEADKKENEIRLLKERNLRVENFDKQMEKLLADRVKEFKEKEQMELNRIKEEYEIKIKTFKEKYKQLEENEFNYLENEFNKNKEKLQADYNNRITSFEARLKSERINLDKQEEDLRKRQEIIQEKRRELELEWSKLNQEEKNLQEKREMFINKIAAQKPSSQNGNTENDGLKIKYEIEKLKLEKSDLENKVVNMQKLLDKYYAGKHLIDSHKSSTDDLDDVSEINDSEKLVAKINQINNKLSHEYDDDDEECDDSDPDIHDDNEIKELVKHAKVKLKLKYYNSKKQAQIDLSNKSAGFSNDTDLDDSEDEYQMNLGYQTSNNPTESNELNINESKKDLLENLAKEKDALQIANELLEHYKQTLLKRKLKLENAQSELKNDEQILKKIKSPSEKIKHQHLIEERKLALEKEALDLEQLGLNLKTGKRLIKQKKSQLNLLENNLLGNLSHLSDTSSSQDEMDIESKSQNQNLNINSLENVNNFISFKNSSNLNEFVNKLKLSQSRGDLSEAHIQKMAPILKKLPKLNNRLELTFDNIKSSNDTPFLTSERVLSIKDQSLIDKKWKKYLNQTTPEQNEKVNFFQNLTNNYAKLKISPDSSKILSNAWENSPAYQKLTFESGSRLLEDKWNQYLGISTSKSLNLKKLNSVPSSTTAPISFTQFLSNSPITLPASTQNRLNQHREWIKKFKASGHTTSHAN